MASKSSTILDRIDFSKIFEIEKGKTLGLQLPDGLKYWAREIAKFLEDKGYEVVISASPTYGSCDIDLNLLKHVDYLIHIAHSPMKFERVVFLPYFYEYQIDVELIRKTVKEKKIALAGTANYAWKFREVKEKLEKSGYNVFLGKGDLEFEGQVLGCNFTSLRGEYEAVLFIGDGLFHPLGIAFLGRKVYRYSPLSGEIEEVKADEFKKERYKIATKAIHCEKFGILVSSKPGQFNMKKAKEALKILKEQGKEAFIVFCDEITPEKLRNFDFDCYINTACPRIAYDDWKKFDKPIITLPELKFAFGMERDVLPDFKY